MGLGSNPNPRGIGGDFRALGASRRITTGAKIASGKQFGVGVEGLEELVKDFGAWPNEVSKVSRRVVTALAARVRKRARQLAPVASDDFMRTIKKGFQVEVKRGTLRRGIKSRGTKSRSNPRLHWGEVFVNTGTRDSKDAFFWRFVEFGTQTSRPQPFIRPAIAEIEPRIPQLMFAEVEKQMNKQFAKRAKAAARA